MPRFFGRTRQLETELASVREQLGQLTEAAERTTLVSSPSSNRADRAAITSGSARQEMQVLYNAYLSCPPISSAISTIAKRMTSGGIELEPAYKGADPANKIRAENLIHYCNDDEDIVELTSNAIESMFIFGSGMWEVVDVLGIPYQLYLADAVTVLPEFDSKGTIIRYVQRMADGTTEILEPEQIVRFALRGPRGETLSPIRKLLGNATIYANMRRWQQKFFENGARPDGYIQLPERTTEVDAERQDVHFSEHYSGVENAGTWPILYGGADLKGFPGSTAVDLDFLKGIDEVSMEILQVLGVPLSQMGVSRGGGLANEGESFDKAFRNNTVNPVRRLFEEKATYRILRQGFGIYDWNIRLREANYDNDQLLVTLVVNKVKAGLITFDEARTQLGENGKLPGKGGKIAAIQLSREVVPVADLADANFHSTQFQQGQQATQPGEPGAAPGATPQEALSDLARWQRIALKAVQETKPQRPFTSSALSEAFLESVSVFLQVCTSEAEVREVFDTAFAHIRGA